VIVVFTTIYIMTSRVTVGGQCHGAIFFSGYTEGILQFCIHSNRFSPYAE